MNLTANQTTVLQSLREIGRKNLYRYASSCPYLFQEDCKKIVAGDPHCVFGMGGLSWYVGPRTGLPTSSVLAIFKQLERQGLVIRESSARQGRATYWWPVGFADQLCLELADTGL